nr:unnamed protein product [Callosobruchus analis]
MQILRSQSTFLKLFLTKSFRYQHQCPKCCRRYTLPCNLRRHMKYQCGSLKHYKCPYCNLESKLKYDMKKHVARMHPERTAEFHELYKSTLYKL